ncbi:DNA-directed RNA polymerase III subunit C1 (rpo31) [Saxophila tyrrhenica]|uniref:DNA-directed RNA polymerase subunit n=1 Tax=Saxophila tyrrhenica TaxID=1690608 RepID=A0AAV9P9Y0_9PEZI|nr:DNA-directed RNA polymerase III subunit C1 (rpo31) [Saxophila tyrrhenica]
MDYRGAIISKDQVATAVPKKVKALKFGLLSAEDILSQSVLQVQDRNLFDVNQDNKATQRRLITQHGPNDQRLGTSAKAGKCETCGEGLKDCNGHFGHVKLALPCFHYGYMRKIIEVLNCVCKDCCRILMPENERRTALKAIRRPGLDNLRKKTICKKIVSDCRKMKLCPHCGAHNGPVKKVAKHPVKMTHHPFQAYISSNAKSKVKPHEMLLFESSFRTARKSSTDAERYWQKAVDDMHPLRVISIFRGVPNVDVELLGMDPHSNKGSGRPENMLWTHVPAPPVAIRPSVAQENASTEDDITNKLGDIIQMNNLVQATLLKGQPLNKVMELWEFLQVQIAMYIDGNIPGLGQDQYSSRSLRGFCQRLKGKQGRFRGNLSGKRVDFSGRTVISPDPNLGIDEVAVPSRVATHMTYPEKVTRYNIQKLKNRILNGDKVHPGANFVIKGADKRRIVLKFVGGRGDLDKIADKLVVGDIVERHLEDGDIVLFNRQPSLHKLSILSHRVKVRPWRTFRLNECVCNPYNADFDGDEMNLHVPQTEEARTEALELMGVKHNLATPKNGAMIIAAIQDFITATYLLSQKDRFFSRSEFVQIASSMFVGMEVRDPYTGKTWPVKLPPPAIWKPRALWTGKQVWSLLLKPCEDYPVDVNLEAKGKQFSSVEFAEAYGPDNAALEARMANDLKSAKTELDQMRDDKDDLLTEDTKNNMYRKKEEQWRKDFSAKIAPDMSITDSYLVIRNSEVMCGTLDKATVGDGKKDSVFYVILRDFGPEYAVEAMNRLARLSARWLGEQGFSIGIGDVYPSDLLRARKDGLVRAAYEKCIDLIGQFNRGELKTNPGCDEEATLEQEISSLLSKVREDCGAACLAELSRFNAPLIMAKCGSKGSNINVAQMVAAVGQQIIGGERVVDGFENRTLPHFIKGSRDPPAKGFVVNSFFSGLNPTEFIFHAMSGREGLVDTAVKTAETGYMSRRLMKSMEDLSARYDGTVRESGGGVVQMKFGDDGLDPVDMEGKAKPVNFDRTWSHAIESTWNNEEAGLEPKEIDALVEELLRPQRAIEQKSHFGPPKRTSHPAKKRKEDEQEDNSGLKFLVTVTDYIQAKVDELEASQRHLPGSDQIFKLTRPALERFLALCLRKFEKSKVEAGHAVGAVGAQSIGEPGTQMTLKTFHFAGVAGMSITQGVPRIKEIINASKTISTPVITCKLESPYEEIAARFAKAIIQKSFLKDIVAFIEDCWWREGYCVNMRVDWQQVERLGLRLTLEDVADAIERAKVLRGMGVVVRRTGTSHVRVALDAGAFGDFEDEDIGPRRRGQRKKTPKKSTGAEDPAATFEKVQVLKRRLPQVVVGGYPDAQRAVLQKGDKVRLPDGSSRVPLSVLVEGYGLAACMTTPGVDGTRTSTNSVMETRAVLGIEAARTTIISEISSVMSGMDIDPRHMQLLADVMTYRGDVLGITRFGLAKMRDSVLQLASFEKTPDHLFEAAIGGRKDNIEGVSESIIMGQGVRLGTGGMGVLRDLGDVKGESDRARGVKRGVKEGEGSFRVMMGQIGVERRELLVAMAQGLGKKGA